MRITRRKLVVLASAGALLGGFRFGHQRLARPSQPSGALSANAQALIAKAWQGLDPSKVLDAHVHVVGLGRGETGCRVGERLTSPTNPGEYFKYTLFMSAAGVTDERRADQQYIGRLAELVRTQTPHGRLLLFAFDQAYGEDGLPRPDESEFYTPNDYVTALAKASPELFVACASVHPYRADAIEALEKAVEQGAVAVKWLPNSMGIDPSSPRCDPFYEAMARLRIPLISHAGEEKAVHAEEKQRFGNPLLLRRALSKGVTVAVAHCASLGSNPDLDAPAGAPWVDNFELFMRLMREREWAERLYGEISALTLVNRLGTPLKTLLEDERLHSRLISGSDYPVCAINALMQTRAIVEKGFLTEDERTALNEIDQHNPLLFDFVLKRTVRSNGHRFHDSVFTARPAVFARLA